MDDPRFKHVATDPRFKVTKHQRNLIYICMINIGHNNYVCLIEQEWNTLH